ncbi:MAG: hypothetical protein ACLFPS_02325 [Clostridia bacterium]
MTAIEFSRYAHTFSAFEIEHLLFNQPDNKIDKVYKDLDDIIRVAKRAVDSETDASWLDIRKGITKLQANFNQTLIWFENPKILKNDLSEFFLENSIEYLVNTSGEYVAEKLLNRYIDNIELSNPFIEIGLIDLSKSELFKAQGEIDLIVNYNIEIQIPFLINTTISSTASSKTRAFISNSITDDNDSSVWNTKDYWWRGKFIISQEMKSISFKVPDITGIHGAEYKNSLLKLYRITSFDPFRKTNDLDQFSSILLKHINTYSKKVLDLNEIVIESKFGKKRNISLRDSKLVKKIIVIIPENIEQDKLRKMNKVKSKYEDEYDLSIQLKLAYGNSSYDN